MADLYGRDQFTARTKGCVDPVTSQPRTWCNAENAYEAQICGRCGNPLVMDDPAKQLYGYGVGPFGSGGFGDPYPPR